MVSEIMSAILIAVTISMATITMETYLVPNRGFRKPEGYSS